VKTTRATGRRIRKIFNSSNSPSRNRKGMGRGTLFSVCVQTLFFERHRNISEVSTPTQKRPLTFNPDAFGFIESQLKVWTQAFGSILPFTLPHPCPPPPAGSSAGGTRSCKCNRDATAEIYTKANKTTDAKTIPDREPDLPIKRRQQNMDSIQTNSRSVNSQLSPALWLRIIERFSLIPGHPCYLQIILKRNRISWETFVMSC